MRELRSCDFCGTDAVGVFEVLPPELTPADDQRRVVLCDHCRETLTDVIEPLLTRLGVDERRSSARRTQSSDVDSNVEVPDDASAETGASTATTSGMESDGDAVSVGVDSVDPAPTPPEPGDYDSPADDTADPLGGESSESEDDAEAETEAEAEAETETETEAETETETEAETETDVGEETAEPSEPDEQATTDDEEGSDTPSEPPQFRKVVRILQNREFPVERADVEALASNAYDLDDEQVAEIFDYAVERGLLVDDGGTLRKP